MSTTTIATAVGTIGIPPSPARDHLGIVPARRGAGGGARHFGESPVFRIDHFLGKESVDNILAFRFANGMFEPSLNRKHIAYVQIDVPETLSIEGRADFMTTPAPTGT